MPWPKMNRAIRHVRKSAHAVWAECPYFPYFFHPFDATEMALVKEWAEQASRCLLRAICEEAALEATAEDIEDYLHKCRGVQKIIMHVPPTVDTLDCQERMRLVVERLNEAMLLLDQGAGYTFRRDGTLLHEYCF